MGCSGCKRRLKNRLLVPLHYRLDPKRNVWVSPEGAELHGEPMNEHTTIAALLVIWNWIDIKVRLLLEKLYLR